MSKYYFKLNEYGNIVTGTCTNDDVSKPDWFDVEGDEEIWNNQHIKRYNFISEQFEDYTPEPMPEYKSEKEIDEKVVSMIREHYSINDELKTLRIGVCNNTDIAFILYNNYVEDCKAWGRAKKIELNFIIE